MQRFGSLASSLSVQKTAFGRCSRKPALVQSQVRFNRVREKVPVKVWEALVQSQVKFNRVPVKFRRRFRGALVQSQVKFNRVPELCCSQVKFNRVPENVWEALVQTRSGSIAFRRRFRKRWEALMQSQVKFNRVPDKAPEKVPEK